MKQFEFTTTHALSVLVILLITIFLFQPSIFGTMINTFLGRLTLLFILILITSYHTMCGLVSVLLIIALYEYYNRFEGQQNMSDSLVPPINPSPPPTDKPKDNVQPNDSGSISSPQATIPKEEPVHPVNTNAMDSTKKTELEGQIQKGNNSKQLPLASTNSNPNVAPSESTKTSSISTKQGFANMFGNDWAPF
jgi:cytoskeletal protein RodZ